MKDLFIKKFRLIAVFIITFASCMFLLTLVDMIPQSAIKSGSEKSAQYLIDKESFGQAVEGKWNTTYDNYADSILFNIIYNIDSSKPFTSTIKSSYYESEDGIAINDYYTVVKSGLTDNSVDETATANVDYFRYWHGSMVLLRPLLCVFSIEQIRIVLGIILAILTILLCIMLWKSAHRELIFMYIFALISVNIWMLSLCVEYVTTFLVMSIICMLVVRESKKEQSNYLPLFVISGVLTCFFDFLTTETITFTVPILFIIIFRLKGDKLCRLKEEFIHILKCGLAWLISYAMMFAAKWGIAMAVLGKTAFASAMKQAEYRLNGEIVLEGSGAEATFFQKIYYGLCRNLGCLFNSGVETKGSTLVLISIGIVMLVAAIIYLLHGKSTNYSFILLAVLIGLIPYIRYMCINNHSYIHFFFTYRAQFVTVLAILAILWYSIDKKLIFKNRTAPKKSVVKHNNRS